MIERVGIFTTNSVDKLHPRIALQEQILSKAGYDLKIIRAKSRREGFIYELINFFSLKYFKWGFIHKHKKDIEKYDIVHVYDFCLLPLARYASKRHKKVIYETLDDNVHLHFHALQRIVPLIRIIKGVVINRMATYERQAALKFCDKVIVNSPNLLENFKEATLIHYTSPFEGLKNHLFNNEMETAFLYLGKLTEAKGARIYKELVKRYKLKLIFIGKAFDEAASDLLKDERVTSHGEHESAALKPLLEKLINEYNLIGLSVIIPENKSYLLQEANKDIDYLAMGIPFIGNDRPPTLSKISKGAGALYSEKDRVSDLIENEIGAYDRAVKACYEIYLPYAFDNFSSKVLDIYQEIG